MRKAERIAGKNRENTLKALHRGVIISCQARKGDPTYGVKFMVAFAQSAKTGGAAGIRTDGVKNVKAVKKHVGLPIIGIWKEEKIDTDGTPYLHITGKPEYAIKLVKAGSDIVAVDASMRMKEEALKEIVKAIHSQGALAMADISTEEEALRAEKLGFDVVSTTLSGYTPWTKDKKASAYEPDFELVEILVKKLELPVVAEGRIWEPSHVRKMFELGAWSVVIGSAITRPWLAVKRFVEAASGT